MNELQAQYNALQTEIEALQAKQVEIAKQIEAAKTTKTTKTAKTTKTTKTAKKDQVAIIKPDIVEELTKMVNNLTIEQLTEVWQKLGWQVHPKFTENQLRGVLLISDAERIHGVLSRM